MSTKERPFIDAVSRLGALPGFLFSNPFWTGFFAMFMAAFFIAFTFVFNVFGRGEVSAAYLFDAGRVGGAIGLGVTALIYIGVALSAVFQPGERKTRLLFVLGGFTCAAILVVLDFVFADDARAYLANMPPLMGSAPY